MTQSKPSSQKMDMLNGPIWNKLIQYALPVAATGILEQLFNASDFAIVGNFTGAAKTIAVAAVGANSPRSTALVQLLLLPQAPLLTLRSLLMMYSTHSVRHAQHLPGRIMAPVSLATTAVLIFIALMCYRPSQRYRKTV